jgi:plasmid stabilization system protein ParE
LPRPPTSMLPDPETSRFLEALEEGLERIRQSPEAYPLVTPILRRILPCRSPYAVYHRVFPGFISLVGVVHGRRHPRRRRLGGG